MVTKNDLLEPKYNQGEYIDLADLKSLNLYPKGGRPITREDVINIFRWCGLAERFVPLYMPTIPRDLNEQLSHCRNFAHGMRKKVVENVYGASEVSIEFEDMRNGYVDPIPPVFERETDEHPSLAWISDRFTEIGHYHHVAVAFYRDAMRANWRINDHLLTREELLPLIQRYGDLEKKEVQMRREGKQVDVPIAKYRVQPMN